jgi:hypothetical protein
MTFHLKSQKLCLGQITDQYADVYLHIEENGVHSMFKANKVILAFHSPYFHRIFQSRANIQTIDVAFVGIKPILLRGALKMMYGQNTEFSVNLVDRFSALLNLLELDFEKCTGYVGQESSSTQKRIKFGPTVSKECDAKENQVNNETSENESCVKDMYELQEHTPLKSSMVDITTPITFSTVASTSLSVISTGPSGTTPASSITTTTPSVTMAVTKTSITRPSEQTITKPRADKMSETPITFCTVTPTSLSVTSSGTSGMTTGSPLTASTPSVTMALTKTHITRPSGPTMTKPKADKRNETVVNPVTETSESGLAEELTNIDFSIGVSSIGHHKDYACCHCGKTVVSLVQAKLHFIDAHQNCEEEKETISEIMKYKKVAIKEIQELQETIHKGANKTLANSQLRSIIENLRKHEDTLKKLTEKNLPPNLIRKRSDIIKSFHDIITKVEQLIDCDM